jgi:hypothetical protein
MAGNSCLLAAYRWKKPLNDKLHATHNDECAQLEFVWAQQWDVVWRNYVHERFKDRDSATDTRRRHLALDLGAKGDWVPTADIQELTPQLARAYANKTAKTVQRYLNALHEMGLIVREQRRVRAQREIVLSFLPLRLRPTKKEGI